MHPESLNPKSQPHLTHQVQVPNAPSCPRDRAASGGTQLGLPKESTQGQLAKEGTQAGLATAGVSAPLPAPPPAAIQRPRHEGAADSSVTETTAVAAGHRAEKASPELTSVAHASLLCLPARAAVAGARVVF